MNFEKKYFLPLLLTVKALILLSFDAKSFGEVIFDYLHWVCHVAF